MKANIIKDGINSLIQAGYYKDRETLLEEAFRTLLEVRPGIKIDMAIEMYRNKKVSLARAAEISGLCQEGFKNVIAQRGIKRIIPAPSKSELSKEVKRIIG
ncbi:MAG: UPF0175 family protein [Methanoregula sp.]|jgi:predicted HTH domain antitoxin|nr:UPF0175 family protein [Methanoregula sp.]